MKGFISARELTEITQGLVALHHGTPSPPWVDIDSLVTKTLRLPVVYERFATADSDCVGFTSNGETPLAVFRNGRSTEVLYPKDTIVLEEYLSYPNEEYTRRFTLAHEVGHVLLNRADPLQQAACFNRLYDNERQYTMEDLRAHLKLSETQANHIAAALLMPYGTLSGLVRAHTKRRKLPVYGDSVFLPETKVILHEMSRQLGVSHTTLLIQLRKYNLLSHHSIDEYIKKHLRGVT